jgi:uncharacterized protein (TIGR02466 family)
LTVESLFVTKLHHSKWRGADALNAALAAECHALAREDRAGRQWCQEHHYRGYTSYASLNDLSWRSPTFAALEKRIVKAASGFAAGLGFDMQGRKLLCDSLWVNILEPQGHHTAHIHPHSAISGTYYVEVPQGAGALRLEDPRLAAMMAAPVRMASAPRELQPFVIIEPKASSLLMWESWLRHEVLPGKAKTPRISISFNLSVG